MVYVIYGENEFSNWNKGQPDNGDRGDQDCANNNIGSLLRQWDGKSWHAKWPVLFEASGKTDVELIAVVDQIILYRVGRVGI